MQLGRGGLAEGSTAAGRPRFGLLAPDGHRHLLGAAEEGVRGQLQLPRQRRRWEIRRRQVEGAGVLIRGALLAAARRRLPGRGVPSSLGHRQLHLGLGGRGFAGVPGRQQLVRDPLQHVVRRVVEAVLQRPRRRLRHHLRLGPAGTGVSVAPPGAGGDGGCVSPPQSCPSPLTGSGRPRPWQCHGAVRGAGGPVRRCPSRAPPGASLGRQRQRAARHRQASAPPTWVTRSVGCPMELGRLPNRTQTPRMGLRPPGWAQHRSRMH